MKITLVELRRIIREVAVSGTGIATPAGKGELTASDKEALEAQLNGLNSQRQQALNKGDAPTANELAVNIAKIEKMLNA